MDERIRLCEARRVIIKIGTRVVTGPAGGFDAAFLSGLAAQVERLRADGRQVIIITSGAVHMGRRILKLTRRSGSVSLRQAAAAVGQPEIMHQYIEAFATRGIRVAQMLLTMDDMRDRRRYLHIRNTLEALLSMHVVPVLNENDSVSVESVTFGENDKLAAMVAASTLADLLIFLSDQPGLLTADPREDANAELVELVRPGDDVSRFAGASGGPESVGGMVRKIGAAAMAADCGVAAVIADGGEADVLLRIVSGQQVGTLFAPGAQAQARKLWMATATEPSGALVVDAGARVALTQADGASLLPRGITEVIGEFEAGEIVRILGPDGGEFARGQTHYSAAEVRQIQGAHSSQISPLLGHPGQPEVVHRDYMVLTAQ
jgi:glutamate 5-kinase